MDYKDKGITTFREITGLKKKLTPRADGQTMVEFSFCMILVVILLIGLIKVFVWSGQDLINRRQTHESVLMDPSVGPAMQIRPVFYYSTRFNAAVDSNVYGQ